MESGILFGLVLIISIGIGATWLAWRLKLPSILILLLAGILVGPILGLVQADDLLGETLFPIVSLSVAIILFEGGLSLKFNELKEIGGIVLRLMTIGTLVTWILAIAGSYYLLHLPIELSFLFGAILIVTGPTVIIPLLRQVRPSGQVGPILKWEGIVNDPIGAMFAVIVFEILLSGGFTDGLGVAFGGIVRTIFFGGGIGAAGASILYIMLRKNWIPDFLQNPVALSLVVLVFELSNLVQSESGLLSVTVMGILLANQERVQVKHIIEFKENLRVILIASLFIILASRLTFEDLAFVNGYSIGFLFFLILVVRPLSIVLSSIKQNISWKEQVFLMAMAPRGIVAAAVSSLFAIRLANEGYEAAELLVPYSFVVIIGTVAIYGLSATPISRWLGLSKPVPSGTIILGAHPWALQLACFIQHQGYKVLVADTNPVNIELARQRNLEVYHGNILADYALDDISLDGIGHLLALTPNDEVNTLACIRFRELFGKHEVFQLANEHGKEELKLSNQASFGGQVVFYRPFVFSQIEEANAQESIEFSVIEINSSDEWRSILSKNTRLVPIAFFSPQREEEFDFFSEVSEYVPKQGDKIIVYEVER